MSHLETANQLESSIEAGREWLLKLDPTQVHIRPAEDRWTIAEVIGHLIDSACNNHQRFIRAQETDELEFPKYDQNNWVNAGGYNQFDWTRLVELWFLYNGQLANVIRNVPAGDLETKCTILPNEPCTLEFLISDYVDHLNHHLTKIQDRL